MKRSVLVLLSLLLSLSTASLAGQKLNEPVFVYAPSQIFYGSIGDTRNSPDHVQFLGCRQYSYETYSTVSCAARDASGTYVTCYNSSSAPMKQSVTSIGPSSYVLVMYNTSGVCTTLYVANGSMHSPAQL